MKDLLKIVVAGSLILSAITGTALVFLIGGHIALGCALMAPPAITGLGILATK